MRRRYYAEHEHDSNGAFVCYAVFCDVDNKKKLICKVTYRSHLKKILRALNEF